MSRSVTAAFASVVVAFTMTGCSEPNYPRDTEGTMERVQGSVLRVGVSEREPFTEVSDAGEVSGTEADVVEAYAETLDATVEYTTGPESDLVVMLHDGELDLVIGGLTSKSPWSKEVSLTKPWTSAVGPDGKQQKIAMAVRAGENALQTNLEKYFAAEGLKP